MTKSGIIRTLTGVFADLEGVGRVIVGDDGIVVVTKADPDIRFYLDVKEPVRLNRLAYGLKETIDSAFDPKVLDEGLRRGGN